MDSNQFQCAKCKKVYTKELSEEEAREQLQREFKGAKVEDCVLICDICYKEMFQE